MIQKKWFSVEHQPGGTLGQVREVEAKGRNGSVVRFYEATDKADACSQAAQWYLRIKAQQNASQNELRARRIAKGKCTHCELPAIPGRRTCARHIDRRRNRNKRPPATRPHYATLELAATALREANRASSARHNARIGGPMAKVYWNILRKLRMLGADGLEAWLIARIPNYEQLMAKESGAAEEPLAQAAE